jgi:hypothetical protein
VGVGGWRGNGLRVIAGDEGHQAGAMNGLILQPRLFADGCSKRSTWADGICPAALAVLQKEKKNRFPLPPKTLYGAARLCHR